jgi:hypothetical protein
MLASPCQRAHNGPRTRGTSTLSSPARMLPNSHLPPPRPRHRPPLSSSLSVCRARPLFFPISFAPVQTLLSATLPLAARPRRALPSMFERAITLPSLIPTRRSSLELSLPTGMPSPEGLFHHLASSSQHGESRRPAHTPTCSPSFAGACAHRLSVPHRPGRRLRPRHNGCPMHGDYSEVMPRRVVRPSGPPPWPWAEPSGPHLQPWAAMRGRPTWPLDRGHGPNAARHSALVFFSSELI